MRFLLTLAVGAAAFVSAALGQQGKQAPWTPLFDGKTTNGWTAIGTANWSIADGAVQANMGNGFLVSKESYKDFELRVEFWADEDANSGVYVRCTNTSEITADNAYEFNIYDKRPDPTYGTGTVVNVGKASQPMKAANKWNTFELRLQGDHLELTMNGIKTVDARDSKLAQGAIALQAAAGTIKFRKVEIRKL